MLVPERPVGAMNPAVLHPVRARSPAGHSPPSLRAEPPSMFVTEFCIDGGRRQAQLSRQAGDGSLGVGASAARQISRAGPWTRFRSTSKRRQWRGESGNIRRPGGEDLASARVGITTAAPVITDNLDPSGSRCLQSSACHPARAAFSFRNGNALNCFDDPLCSAPREFGGRVLWPTGGGSSSPRL